MKKGQLIKSVHVKKGMNQIDLEGIYPILEINNKNITNITYYVDNTKSETNYCERLEFEALNDTLLEVFLGVGYVAEKDEFLTKLFTYKEPWGGSDGIYSFNLEDGNDAFDQKDQKQTLFVFGDTFVGRVDPVTFRRYEPLLMPNNSLAYYDPIKKTAEHLINKREDGMVQAFFGLDSKFNIKGTIPQNLVTYDRKKPDFGFLSGLKKENIIINFDLHKERHLTMVSISNYFSPESITLSDRGLKEIDVLVSNDNQVFKKIETIVLDQSKSEIDEQQFKLDAYARYVRFSVQSVHGIGEGVNGLSRVKFYQDKQLLRDVYATSNTVLTEESALTWLWLQDGVVIDNHLYFIPMTIISDPTEVEGLQFALTGTVLLDVPIKEKRLDLKMATQKLAPLLVEKDGSTYLYGGAIMSHTKEAGALNPDGYIYVYGYKTTFGLREALVARVLPKSFTTFDDYEYFDGRGWSKNIYDSAPLFPHVSCEFSVSEIRKGDNKGKLISVFQYDTNTRHVAFSIGDTPYGPFSKPQKIYFTREYDEFKFTTYTYNAKAHPHLSESESILVTYNTNTYNFDHNMSNANIYHPRFIVLNHTNKE